MGKCILITGGARSGKSRLAVDLAKQSGKAVLFVATATSGDEEMRRRIERHRRSRPAEWVTLEVPEKVGYALIQNASGFGFVIIDCITLLVNNIFSRFPYEQEGGINEKTLEQSVRVEIEELLGSMDKTKADFAVVTNEVGLGLVPPNIVGRLYRDVLGMANQMLARRADEVYLMVSGLPLKIKPAL